MKAAQMSKAGGDWELVERDIPELGPGQVRVKVEACGICHSDALVKDGIQDFSILAFQVMKWRVASTQSATTSPRGLSVNVLERWLMRRNVNAIGASLAFYFR